jgi:peptidoglycan/LPS O-acetylase OafA/YrhL
MTGAALAVVARMPGGLNRLKALAPKAFSAGLIALAALALVRGGLDYHEPVAAVAALPVIALVYGALLTMAVTGPPSSRLVRMLSSVSLGKWGKYSYGIYVVHFPLLGAIEWKTTFLRNGVALVGGSRLPSVLLVGAMGMALSYALGWLSYHVYEKRFLALKRYFDRTSTVRVSGAAVA